VFFATVAAPAAVYAQDAAWLQVPVSSDWEDPNNWTGGVMPTGVATFDATTLAAITINDPFVAFFIDTMSFTAGAPQYSFTMVDSTLLMEVNGVVNSSPSAPIFNLIGCGCSDIAFENSTSAGNGIYNLTPGDIQFDAFSTAGTATFNVQNGSSLSFFQNSTAAAATVHVDGTSQLQFWDQTSGGTSRVILDAGALLDLTNATAPMTIGSIEGDGTIDTGSFGYVSVLSVGANNRSTTFGGDIIGAAGLEKVGSGTLTLTGNNSYTGGTTVTAGTLAGTTNGLQGDIVNNATLQFDQNFDGTYAGALTGTGTVVKSGSGMVTFSSTGNTYTGATQVLAGTLQAAVVDAFGNLSAVTVASGATLDLNGNDQTIGSLAGAGTVTFGIANLIVGGDNTDTTFSGSLIGGGALTKTGTGSWLLTGDNSGFTGITLVSDGTLVGNAASLPALIFNNAAVRFDQSSDGTYSGEIDGNGSVIKTGAGTLTLNGPNNYLGGTTLSAGLVAISDASSLGAGTITFDGGGLRLTSAVTFTQTLALAAGGGTVETAAGVSATIAQAVSGTGALTKTGGGTLTLTGANNYSGGTTVSGGTLAGTTTSLQGAIVNNATVQFDQNTNGTYAGAMSGTGSLLKTGNGIVTLSGANSYAGTTTINGGTLQAGATNAFSATSATTIASGATLDLNSFNQTIGTLAGAGAVTLGSAQLTTGGSADSTFDGTISGSGSLTKVGAGTLTLTGANNYTGGTTVSGGTIVGSTTSLLGTIVNNAAVQFNQTADGTYAGTMSGSGTLTKTGGGTLTLSGSNTYTGATVVSNGTLRAAAANAFSSASATTVASGATLDLAGFDETIGSLSGGGAVTLGVGRLTVGADATSTTFDGMIVGTGGVTKIGAGTLTLTGANSYSGGTIVSGGTLAGTTTSLQGSIVNNAIVQFDQAFDGTFAGIMSGSGALVKTGTGTLTLTGTNTFNGGTTVNGGRLVASTTSLQGAIVDNAAVRFDQPVDGVFNGAVSGTGTLTKIGDGVLTLAGPNTLTGATLVSGGTLRAGAANAFSAASTTSVAAGATLDLNGFSQTVGSLAGAGSVLLGSGRLTTGADGTTTTFSGVVSGSGGLTKVGSGTLALTGANTYSGGTIVNGGALVGTAASLQGTIVNNATVQFDQGADGVYAGAMSGTGALVKSGAGTLSLTGTSSYTGGTMVGAGTLAGTSSSLQGAILNNAIVRFDQTANGTYTGAMSGGGALVKTGGGTLTLSGVNTYSGGTLVTGGTLGGNTASLQGLIVDNSAVTFAQNVDGTFAGVLAGTGTLTKTGAATLTFSGVHPFSGIATVAQGQLAIGSAFGGSIVVNAGATLTLASTAAAAPATLTAAKTSTPRGITVAAVGASGVSSVAGNLTLAPGSTYQVATGASGSAPLLVAGGTANVGGATIDVSVGQEPSSRVTQTVLLQAAGGIVGTVDVRNHNTGLGSVVTPVGDLLVLSMLRLDGTLASIATSPNGAQAGAAFDRVKPGSTGDLARVVFELTGLDDQSLSSALATVAGEIHASNVQLSALDTEAAVDLVQARLTDRQRPSGDQRARVAATWIGGRHWWAQLVGQSASFDATADVHGADASLGGFAVGFDQTIGDAWIVGGGGSYERGTLDLSGDAASSRFSAPRAFAYAGRTVGRWTARGGGGTAWTSYDTTRRIAFTARLAPVFDVAPLFGGVDRTATSAPRGLTTDLWGDAEMQASAGAWTLQPRVGVRYAHFGQDAWSESGAGALSLSAPAQSNESAQAEAGLRATRPIGHIAPFGVAAYRRELTDGVTNTTVQLTTDAAGQFTTDGIAFARDTVLVGGGARLPLGRTDISFAYQLRHASGQTRHTASVGVAF
jgi:autotransporter-associated beta strand protein